MQWLPKSGREIEPGVLRRLQTFFDRLTERYPDRTVIHFNRDHKKLAERGTALRRLAGYGEDNDAFFADFGFQYVNALRRQAESHGTYEELVDRLRAAYPDGIVNLYEAEPFRADLSYFARKKRRTAKHILRQAGVLRSRRQDGEGTEETDFADTAEWEEASTDNAKTSDLDNDSPTSDGNTYPEEGDSPTDADASVKEIPLPEENALPDKKPDRGARRDELRRELAECRAQVKRLTGLRALFGGAKRRRALEVRITEIEAELRWL